MSVPAVPGVSNSTLGVALAMAWVFVLGVTLYRYVNGNRSRERFYAAATAGAFWLAYSLLQISSVVSGTAEVALVVLAVGSFCAGIVAGIRWWGGRNPKADDKETV